MELDQEFIEKNNLTEDQVKALGEKWDDTIANEKRTIEEQFKGQANKNAEGILQGVIDSINTKLGVSIPRNSGEKHAEYIERLSSEVLKTKQAEVEKLKADYEKKVKEAGAGDIESIKKQYQEEKDELLKKYADYDEIKEKAVKADEYGQKLTGLKLQVAYSNVKPAFPESVNSYEGKAKWGDFIKRTNEKYDIELDENNESVYIDKENKFKTGKLADLVKADDSISELLKGREQKGTGGDQVTKEKIEGVPFAIKRGATTAEISKAIKDHLLSDGKITSVTSKEYSDKFKEYFQKIKQKTAA